MGHFLTFSGKKSHPFVANCVLNFSRRRAPSVACACGMRTACGWREPGAWEKRSPRRAFRVSCRFSPGLCHQEMGLKMVSTPLYPMVLLIIIPMKNGYFIGNINPTFSDKPKFRSFDRILMIKLIKQKGFHVDSNMKFYMGRKNSQTYEDNCF